MENWLRWLRKKLFHRIPKGSLPIFTLDISDPCVRLRNIQVFMTYKDNIPNITCTWFEEPIGESFTAEVKDG